MSNILLLIKISPMDSIAFPKLKFKFQTTRSDTKLTLSKLTHTEQHPINQSL